MNKSKVIQTRKGIWIQQDSAIPFSYSTWLREKNKDLVAFIPFEHPYEPIYLGSVSFLRIEDYPNFVNRLRVDHGLLQNHFYPLGGTEDIRPELFGKGLAKRIESEIAQNLLRRLQADSPIIIGASSDSHLKYCERIGLVPWKVYSLRDYVRILA